MDKIAHFKAIIKQTITAFAADRPLPDEEVAYKIIADEAEGQYQLLEMGWQQRKRIYHVLFHLEIVGEKIWIHEDNTEASIAELLVEQGLSPKDIVLGYFSAFHRQHTEFAFA